ncbi:PQQ-binding-like beta-propeller repeat protein [Anatilimnocola sp. NA78]|uniref:outer membrane protein assembly factor BamB family protein n=1 Tax=Anatilimnocola sp. NA78 TaxID=3415683 RepID=UPI003CE452E8
MSRCRLFHLCLFVAAIGAPAYGAEPVVGWRTDAQGSYPTADPPTQWSAKENIVWQAAMPGKSYGSPVVFGDRIYIPSDPAELLCLNAADGKILWQHTNSAVEVLGQDEAIKLATTWKELKDRKRSLEKEFDAFRKANPEAKEEFERFRNEIAENERQLEQTRLKRPIYVDFGSGNSTATPVCDGQHVYVVFGSGIVACYTTAGERRWIKFIEGSLLTFGHSSSPLLVDGKLIVHLHDMVALDADTGELIWRTAVPARHASPILIRHEKEDLIVSPGGSIVRASDGKVMLKDDVLKSSEASPIFTGDVLYTQEGKTSALKLPLAGSKDGLEIIWQATASRGRRTPSPVLHRGLLYGSTTEGILEVTDIADGQIVYRKRLDFDGNLYSSVTSAGDYIYLGCTRGTTLVMKAGREFEQVALNKLENYGSNPVFAGQRMYLRGQEHLYCIGK